MAKASTTKARKASKPAAPKAPSAEAIRAVREYEAWLAEQAKMPGVHPASITANDALNNVLGKCRFNPDDDHAHMFGDAIFARGRMITEGDDAPTITIQIGDGFGKPGITFTPGTDMGEALRYLAEEAIPVIEETIFDQYDAAKGEHRFITASEKREAQAKNRKK